MAPELWKILSSTREKTYRVFNLRTDRARSPRTGEAHDFFVIEASDWVNVIPLTPDNRVVLIEQYRHGVRDVTLEIPGGLIEDHDTPAAAASRIWLSWSSALRSLPTSVLKKNRNGGTVRPPTVSSGVPFRAVTAASSGAGTGRYPVSSRAWP